MKTTAIFLGLLLPLLPAAAQQPGAVEIMNLSRELSMASSLSATLRLTITEKSGSERNRTISMTTKSFADGLEKRLVRFMEPADVRGTAMLIVDNRNSADEMWIYLPALKKTRRIVSSEKGKSFMSSEFTNADMSRPNLDDFTYTLLGEETINGKICWKVEALTKSREMESEYGFKRRVSYIEKSTYLIQKSELYDRTDKLNKVMTLGDYRKQSNGLYFSYQMEMKNVQSNRRSEMKVKSFQLGSKLNENSFAVSSLEK